MDLFKTSAYVLMRLLSKTAMSLQFVAMQVRAGHGLLTWVSKVASKHFPFGSPQSAASSPQLSVYHHTSYA